MTTQLEKKALIARMSASMWTAAKNAPSLATELAQAHGASEGRAKVRKHLIDPKSLSSVRGAIATAKEQHQALTLPWADNGERLLPIGRLDEYREKMQAHIDRVNEERGKFLAEYEDLIAEAKTALGTMFDGREYPDASDIERKIGLSYDLNPVPAASHFVADIGEEEAARIRAEIERRNAARIETAMTDLLDRIAAATRHLIERLGTAEDGKPRRLHQSAIDALRDIVTAVPAMNLTGSTVATEAAEKILDLLGEIKAADLRPGIAKTANEAAVTETRRDFRKRLETVAEAYFGADLTPAAD